MLTALIPLIMALSAQTDHIQYGALVPEGAQTFQITLNNGSSFFGAIRVDGQWVKNLSDLDESIPRIEVVPDEPWNPAAQPMHVSRRTTKSTEEPIFRRRERNISGWKNAGHKSARTATGPKYYIEAELELAERAQAMDEENNPETRRPRALGAAQESKVKTPHTESGFIQQWGAHIGVSVVGLVLLVVVLKTMVLRP